MYNSTLVNRCLDVLGLPREEASAVNLLVNQFSTQNINYYNDIESKLVNYIDNDERALIIYEGIRVTLINRVTKLINRANLVDAYYVYRNGLVSLEKTFLRTDEFKKAI